MSKVTVRHFNEHIAAGKEWWDRKAEDTATRKKYIENAIKNFLSAKATAQELMDHSVKTGQWL